MTRATKYVALDVHQATTLASVRAETGRVIAVSRRYGFTAARLMSRSSVKRSMGRQPVVP